MTIFFLQKFSINKSEIHKIQAIAKFNKASEIYSINNQKLNETILCSELPKVLETYTSSRFVILTRCEWHANLRGIFPDVNIEMLTK